jgi:hypothetical protein
MSKEIKVGDWVRVVKDDLGLGVGNIYKVIEIVDKPLFGIQYVVDVSKDERFEGDETYWYLEEEIELVTIDGDYDWYTVDYQERYDELVKELEETDKLNAFLKDIIEQQAEIIEYLLQQR